MSSRDDDRQSTDLPDDLTTIRDAYCVRCKAKRVMKSGKHIKMKSGRSAISGKCAVCGSKMFRIGSNLRSVKSKRVGKKSRKTTKNLRKPSR